MDPFIKGLTNLIWVWDVQDLDFNWVPCNPGDGYWDVLALATGMNVNQITD